MGTQPAAVERSLAETWTTLVEDLTGADRDTAVQLLSCCSTLAAANGEEAAVPDDAALLAVESGTVLLVARGSTRSAILAFARRGDLLLPPLAAEAVVGLGPGSLRVLDADAVAQLLTFRGAGQRLLDRLGAVVRDRQESLHVLAVSPLRERVRAKLLQLARAHGRVRADGVRIALPLTHELLARSTGASRETVTLAIRDLRHEEFLARSGRSYLLRVAADELDGHPTPSSAAPAA